MHQPDDVKFATTQLATGVRLHYAERGDREGEAIIFLHGYSDSWFSFSRVLPLLSPEYHAFALTQRGHGDSDKPEWIKRGNKRVPSERPGARWREE